MNNRFKEAANMFAELQKSIDAKRITIGDIEREVQRDMDSQREQVAILAEAVSADTPEILFAIDWPLCGVMVTRNIYAPANLYREAGVPPDWLRHPNAPEYYYRGSEVKHINEFRGVGLLPPCPPDAPACTLPPTVRVIELQ